MPSVTFTSPGDWNSWNKIGSSATLPNWQTTVANGWPDDHNGDSSAVVNTSEPGTPPMFSLVSISAIPIDSGSIPAAATLDTIGISFNWQVENSPDFTTDASSELRTAAGAAASQPEGTSSGAYNETDTALNVIGSTDPADLYLNLFGWGYFVNSTGAFAGTITRRVVISNFVMTVAYTSSSPVVTDVSPTHGDVAGGTVVTLTGTGFTGATTATFGATASPSVTVNSDTSITCVAPPHTTGEVTVSVA